MSKTEETDANEKDRANIIQMTDSPGAPEANVSEIQKSDKFPKWDIMPPAQFINPRTKKLA
jgi:hypothetical protein